MISIGIVWCYVFVLSWILGSGFVILWEKKTGYRGWRPESIVITGLVILTVYAQVFSLFYKVGAVANGVLIAGCLGILGLMHRQLGQLWRRTLREVKCGQWIGWGILFVFFAYGASRGVIHYDTSLYHAQSIRWIEEYGVIPGLGNLHNRLAYNSAAFSLTALFSFPYLFGVSLHGMSGFFAWLIAGYCMRFSKKTYFVRLFTIYYLTTIFNQMISPESDYFMNLMVLFLVIRFCELVEDGCKDVTPYALLCVGGVYAVSLKLSASMILLLTIKPAIMLFKEKRIREIITYCVLGVVVIVPYLARNVILSGWLVYPFPAIDLFDVDWKIPAGLAMWDAAEIKVYGRGLTDPLLADNPLRSWLPQWLHNLSKSNGIFLCGAALTGVHTVIWCVVEAIRQLGKKRETEKQWDCILIQATCVASFLFWFVTAPLVRYGFIFMGLSIAVFLGNLLSRWSVRKPQYVRGALYVFAVAFALWKVVSLGKQIQADYVNDYWVLQKDYENYPVNERILGSFRIYVPKTGDRVGYDAFPSTCYLRPIELRSEEGERLEQGFRSIE